MSRQDFPAWLTDLEAEAFEFLRLFILTSGSLKEMAQHYQVSYPTIRLRLDRLIQKVGTSRQDEDSYVNLIKDLALEGEMSFEVAKKLIAGYRQERR